MKSLILWLLLSIIPVVSAQDGCPAPDVALFDSLKTQCKGLQVGQVCTVDPATEPLTDEGATAPALVRVSAGLTLALIGDAHLQPAEAMVEPVPVTNAGTAPVNLREGAGRSFAVAGVLAAGSTAEVDGQSDDGQWLHLSQGGWVFAELIRVEGSLELIPVMDGNSNSAQRGIAYTLTSAGDCGPSGVLFSTIGTAELTINDTLLTWTTSTAFVGIDEDGILTVSVHDGDVQATGDGFSESVQSGESLSITATGAERTETPEGKLADVPFDLMIAAEGSPEDVVYRYLDARTRSSSPDMQELSCGTWKPQALIQSQSFRAMNAELQHVSCAISDATADATTVTCEGMIRTTYNGQTREWPLSGFELIQEEGAWRICGEID